MPHESDYLEPVEVLDCFGRPFGLEVARAVEAGEGQSFDLVSTRAAVKGLKQRVRAVLNNPDEESRLAVTSVNARFFKDDAWVAHDQFRLPKQGREQVMQWLATARYSDVAKFCLWNVQRQKQAQEAMRRDRDELHTDTLAKAQRLVELGLFPEHAVGTMERALQHYSELHAMDSFESGAMVARGYCSVETMALAKYYFNYYDLAGMQPQMRSTHFHEGLHGVSMTQGMGFVHAVDDELIPDPSSFLEEVSASHHQAVATNRTRPDPLTVAPGQRFDTTNGSYRSERLLMAYMLELGERQAPINVVSNAHFEKLSRSGTARRELALLLRDNMAALFPDYGKEAFQKFNTEYNDAERIGGRQGVVRKWTAEIEEQRENIGLAGRARAAQLGRIALFIAAERAGSR